MTKKYTNVTCTCYLAEYPGQIVGEKMYNGEKNV